MIKIWNAVFFWDLDTSKCAKIAKTANTVINTGKPKNITHMFFDRKSWEQDMCHGGFEKHKVCFGTWQHNLNSSVKSMLTWNLKMLTLVEAEKWFFCKSNTPDLLWIMSQWKADKRLFAKLRYSNLVRLKNPLTCMMVILLEYSCTYIKCETEEIQWDEITDIKFILKSRCIELENVYDLQISVRLFAAASRNIIWFILLDICWRKCSAQSLKIRTVNGRFCETFPCNIFTLRHCMADVRHWQTVGHAFSWRKQKYSSSPKGQSNSLSHTLWMCIHKLDLWHLNKFLHSLFLPHLKWIASSYPFGQSHFPSHM